MSTRKKLNKLKKGIKEMGKALRAAGAALYDLNAAAVEIANTQDTEEVSITIRCMSGVEERERSLLEKLAVFEHEKWLRWTRAMITLEEISDKRKERWERQQKIPYKSLCEYDKNFYREAAMKILEVVKQ